MENTPDCCHFFTHCTIDFGLYMHYLKRNNSARLTQYSGYLRCRLKHIIVTYKMWLMTICVWFDLLNIHSITRYWKEIENGHKWSCNVLENAREKVLERVKILRGFGFWSSWNDWSPLQQFMLLRDCYIHRVSKNKQNYFCYNYVKLPPNPTIFGTKMANCLILYEVYSFSTSPNLCQCTTVLITDVPNCHITL